MTFKDLLLATFLAFITSVSYAAPDWMYTGRVGGTSAQSTMSESDLIALIEQRVSENVNILELDTRLSDYLTEAEFDTEVAFIDLASRRAAERGLKTVIYYPSLEALTQNGVTAASTMAKDHPEWLQRGINGADNVFYGDREVWVDPNAESAWLSPNSGYRDYFINRIKKLAATAVDGVWLDVPIYLDTGVRWGGAEPVAAAAFQAWSVAEGLNNGRGYTVPASEDFSNPAFRAWIKWRHINLAEFIEAVRLAAIAVNPEFAVIVENFPTDYLDGTGVGLDATLMPESDNLIHVWEIDSVSNVQAMKWSSAEDFENKISMLKWGSSIHRSQPSWSFSYGNEPLDAGLTLSAVVASGNVPFEAKTPDMVIGVGSEFRGNWFGYVRDHEEQLLTVGREASVGIWYSGTTRDYQDYPQGGGYGMFSQTNPPAPDPDWWANRPLHSVVNEPHLGGYRGLSAAMIRLDIPYSVISMPDRRADEIRDLEMLLLPSVGALSDEEADAIRQYVSNGGVVLATGRLPGTLDDTGALRGTSALAELFGFGNANGPRVNRFGSGLAIYRPDILGTALFGEELDALTAKSTLSAIEQLVRIHVTEPFTLENGEGVYVDRAILNEEQHLLYLVNYSGLQQPLVPLIKPVTVYYHAPAGFRVSSVLASTPDSSGLNGFATVTDQGHGVFRIELPVDQFALLEINLELRPVPAVASYAGPQFDNPAHQQAARSGLDFILDRMRNSSLPEPNRFGVHANLIDNTASTEIYTGGHHVTGEHMGLLLRTTACMNDEAAFDEAYRYVRDVMFSPLYHVSNQSIDKDAQRPAVLYNDIQNSWLNANVPLDDLRVVHGLIDGYENFNRTDANQLANTMLEGLYWTTLTDRNRTGDFRVPQYDGGLLGFTWDWSELDDDSLNPPALASGLGALGSDLIPVDYQDLGTIAHAAERDHRWGAVLQSTTQLLLDAEIDLSGLYFNGFRPDGTFTGDFEYQGDRRGEHLNVTQVLWTAIHLARVANTPLDALSATQKALARESAARSLAYFKNFYTANNRVPEYVTFAGDDVQSCVNNLPAECLIRGDETLFAGESRIYAQLARLALLLGDTDFTDQLIDEQIITDWVSDSADPLYGMIGVETASTGDAEAWNILESVYSMCLNAVADDTQGPPIINNTSPLANPDALTTDEETPVVFSSDQLLANDTDADADRLSLSGIPSRSDNGATVELLTSGDWQYTPPAGFSGIDQVPYAISDGRGGGAIGQITIDVKQVPRTTYLSTAVTVLTGALDYGTIAFLGADDADTYDINSASSAQGNVVDWYARGDINDVQRVSRLQVSYAGHYAVAGVSQETFLYNFQTAQWVLIDARVVGNETDSVVLADITSNPQHYLSATGESRLRVKGSHATQPVTVWANSVRWVASYATQASVNIAPVASGTAVSTTVNTAVAVTLLATDAEAAALTYTLTEQPLNGTLSGVAPNLIYLPNVAFTGTDSFKFTASDGTLQSNEGVVSVSVQPQGSISNIASAITLDGDLSDWAGYRAFDADPDDVTGNQNPLDWRQAWMAHDGGECYLAYRNDGPVNVSWGQTIYFDIDNNAATGYQQGLPLGADRILQGRFLYRYTGSGTDWSWQFITEVEGAAVNGVFEYRFPRSALASSELIHLAFVGSNEPYGGTVEDLYPDTLYNVSATDRRHTYTAAAPTNSAPVAADVSVVTSQNSPVDITLDASDSNGDALQYTLISDPSGGTLSGIAPSLSYQPLTDVLGVDSFSYQVTDGELASRIATVTVDVQSVQQAAIPSNPVAGIDVDGNAQDWTALRYFSDDPNDVTGAENPVDYLRAAMAHDGSNFYLTFDNDGRDLTILQEWLFTVYIDTDRNPATGYQGGLAFGADYMQQGSGVFRYAGTGDDWTWAAAAASNRVALGSTVELTIPRQTLGNPSRLDFVLIGDNLSVNGGVEDVYPDGTYNSSAAVRFLSYTTNDALLAAQALPAFDAALMPVSGRVEMINNPRRPGRQAELEGAPLITTGSGVLGVWGLLMLIVAGVLGDALRRIRGRNQVRRFQLIP